MKQSIRMLMIGAAVAAAFAVTASSAMAWNPAGTYTLDTNQTGGAKLLTNFKSGGVTVAWVQSDLSADADLTAGLGNLGSVDTTTTSFTSSTSSSGLTTVVSANGSSWGVSGTNAGSGSGPVSIVADFDVKVKNGSGVVVGSADASGTVTGAYTASNGRLKFTNATGLGIYAASGVLAGLNGLPGELSGTLVETSGTPPSLN
jgi:hypothetical protein